MPVDEIIGMADDAMYKIKKNGKSNFGILNKELVEKPVPDKVDEEDVIGGSDNSNVGTAAVIKGKKSVAKVTLFFYRNLFDLSKEAI